MNFKYWLKEVADYCESTHRTLIPILTLIYQIHNAEYEEDSGILQLKSATNVDHEQAKYILKVINRLKGQNITFRKWIIQQMPYPSTAHFEYLCFGRRLSRKAKWTTIGRAKLSIIFKHVARQNYKPTQEEFKELFSKISKEANEATARAAIGAIYAHTVRQLGDSKFIFEFNIDEPNNWFIDQESIQTEKAQPNEVPQVKQRTNRSNANSAKHNIKRFSAWILRTESPRIKAEIRRHWNAARIQFQSAVTQTIGEAAVELFLLETDEF